MLPDGEVEPLLGQRERVGPEARLEMRLELREVEVRPASAFELVACVARHVQAEVEQRGRDRLAVDEGMALRKVPAARPDQERRDLLVEAVRLVRRLERDLAAHGVGDVALALDDVLPLRRAGVLVIGHEDTGAGVERVDHHLAVDRAGDLTAPVAEVGRRLGHAPLGIADVLRVGPEARQAPRVELALPLAPPLEQLAAPGIQLAVQARDEVERLARKDFLVGRGKDLHVGEHAHAGSFVNCASSVEPLSASVSLSGATACVTRSK